MSTVKSTSKQTNKKSLSTTQRPFEIIQNSNLKCNHHFTFTKSHRKNITSKTVESNPRK